VLVAAKQVNYRTPLFRDTHTPHRHTDTHTGKHRIQAQSGSFNKQANQSLLWRLTFHCLSACLPACLLLLHVASSLFSRGAQLSAHPAFLRPAVRYTLRNQHTKKQKSHTAAATNDRHTLPRTHRNPPLCLCLLRLLLHHLLLACPPVRYITTRRARSMPLCAKPSRCNGNRC